MDKMAYGKPSVIGAVNGMIAGLVAITPAAGYVDGWGAIAIGVVAGIIPWASMNSAPEVQADDEGGRYAFGILHTWHCRTDRRPACGHSRQPGDVQYIGTDKEAPGVNVTGLLYGNANQLLLQAEGAAFIIAYNVIATLHHPQGDLDIRAAAHG